MPLLTIVNLQSSPMTFQDTSGLTSTSFTAAGSTTTTKAVSDLALNGLLASLSAEQTAGRITWSVKDDPSSAIDNPPSSPVIIDEANFFSISNDFPLAAGGTLVAPLTKSVQAGATGDFVSSVANGAYQIATVAVSEAEAGQLNFGGQLVIDPTKGPVFETRVRVNMPGAALVSGERWVVGLCGTHTNAQDVLDNVTISVWFRGEGANLKLFVEGDDNVHDANLVDSLQVYAKNVFVTLRIDMTDLTKVKFFVNGVQVSPTVNLSSLTSSNLLQPIFCFQRDAGANIDQLQIDWYRVYQGR